MEHWKQERRASLMTPSSHAIGIEEWTPDIEIDEHFARKISVGTISSTALDRDENDSMMQIERFLYLGMLNDPTFSLIQKECAAKDVIHIWTKVCRFISEEMKKGYAVRFPGLGLFTYATWTSPVIQNECQVNKRKPQFLISKYLKINYGLIEKSHFVTTVPTIELNFSEIAVSEQISKGSVDGIITEILQSFARGVICNKNIELPFPSIGKLQIKNKVVEMLFYGKFLLEQGFDPEELESMEDVLCGSMTPLPQHIPTEGFRSVFHLREIRSIHDLPVIRTPSLLQIGLPSDPEFSNVENLNREELKSYVFRNRRLFSYETDAPKRNNRAMTLLRGTNTPFTQSFLLQWAKQDPAQMQLYLFEQLYNTFIQSLGKRKVISHLKPRDNNAIHMKLSY